MPSDKVKRLLEKFSSATIRAAMAENPAVMTAAGWKSTPSGIEQTEQDSEGAKRLRESLTEISLMPLGDVAGEALLAVPAVSRGLRSVRTALKRNSPIGKRLTTRIEKALSRIGDVPISEQANVNPELKEYLIGEGVRPDVLTDDALEKLTRGRQLAVERAASDAQGRYVMRLAPGDGGYQFYTAFEPGFPKTRPTWPDNAIGYVGVEPLESGDIGIQMIENVTRRAYPNPEAHGVSESLMNAVISDKGHVVSGRELLSPEITTHIWKKYPQKELIGNNGVWKTATRTYTDGHPVYKITSPTYDIPLKYGDVFSAKSLDDAGTFLVDFAKGPEFAVGGYLRSFDDGGSINIKPVDKKRISALAKRINETSNADFVKRLMDARRKVLKNDDGTVSTHELGYVTEGDGAVVFPSVQSVGDSLARFPYPESYNRAVERGDTVHMSIPDAEMFTKGYKEAYPGFKRYSSGGKTKFDLGDWVSSKASDIWYRRHIAPKIKELGIDEVRNRLYRNISPYSYVDASKRLKSALNNQLPEFEEFQKRHGEVIFPADRDDIFATYLQIPLEKRRWAVKHSDGSVSNNSPSRVVDSDYAPSVSSGDAQYKALTLNDLEKTRLVNLAISGGDDISDYMINMGNGFKLFPSYAKMQDVNRPPLSIGENRVSTVLRKYFGPHTIGRGVDPERGEYISYYDKWDLAPFNGNGEDESRGIGKPIEFYDRIYLDDYFGVDSRPKNSNEFYGGYIVPAVVTADKAGGDKLHKVSEQVTQFSAGGSIHIKPSHRGRLTELKARTGKTEAELYNDGNPAHKKMVVFARNARKWHADGGPIDYSGIVTTNNRPYNADYISYIDTALANGGMNDYQRAAVLANIIEESGGDPFAEGPGGFYGLLQWSGERYPKTKEKDVYKEIDNQVRNILATAGNSTDKMSWTHGGKGSGYNSFKDAMDAYNGDNLEDVMRGYTLGYVRPAGGLDSYNNRLKVAKQLYDMKGFRRFDAGGFIQKHGRDKILAALKKMKQSN